MPKFISKDRLDGLLSYDAQTGEFIWKQRKGESRGAPVFNSRFAGNEAGCLNRFGHRVIRVDGVAYYAHRLAWIVTYGRMPESLDHINGNPSDNRIENLREVSRLDNQRNQKMRNTNTSGTMGVTKHHNRWVVRIGVGGKSKRFGSFKSKHEAIARRKELEIEYGYHKNHGRLVNG